MTFIRGDGACLETLDQVMDECDVIALAWRTDETDGKAQSIICGMDLGAQAAARPAQTLGISPPLFLRAPAACW